MTAKQTGLQCCTCKFIKQHYSHVEVVEKALQSPNQDRYDCLDGFMLPTVPQQVGEQQYYCLSSIKTQFHLSANVSKVLFHMPHALISQITHPFYNLAYTAAPVAWCQMIKVLSNITAKLFYPTQLLMPLVCGFCIVRVCKGYGITLVFMHLHNYSLQKVLLCRGVATVVSMFPPACRNVGGAT